MNMEYDIDTDASLLTVRTVDWHMMDKWKMYPWGLVSGFTVRMIIHPVSVVRTRIQNQNQKSLYRGTWDAFGKIYRTEGTRAGLYRGFWATMPYLGVHLWYITAMERTKLAISQLFPSIKDHYGIHNAAAGFVAGGSTQFLTVPIDVVSQHLMVAGDTKKTEINLLPRTVNHNGTFVGKQQINIRRFFNLLSQIRRKDGYLGFYRGFLPSCLLFGSNSAVFWFFYENFVEVLETINNTCPGLYLPLLQRISERDRLPNLLLRGCAAPAAGLCTSVCVNWLDVIRVRNQLHRTSIAETVRILLKDEGLTNTITKGLSARMIQSLISAPLVMLGYELVKRFSALPEYKSKIRW